MYYLFSFGAHADDAAAMRALHDVLDSVTFDTAPIRVKGRGISMLLPEGWRQMGGEEAEEHRPSLKLTEVQKRVSEGKPPVLLTIIRNLPDSNMSASIQIKRIPDPDELRGATSMEIANVLAFGLTAAYHGTSDGAHQTKPVSGMRAAEWRMRYTLTHTNGETSAMLGHLVVVTLPRQNAYILIGYIAPESDTADAMVFEKEIVPSIEIASN
jgi:hypothetical protein